MRCACCERLNWPGSTPSWEEWCGFKVPVNGHLLSATLCPDCCDCHGTGTCEPREIFALVNQLRLPVTRWIIIFQRVEPEPLMSTG